MKTRNGIFGIVLASFLWMACDDDNKISKPSLNEKDEEFVETAARANLAQTTFGELAYSKGTSVRVKEFGQEMATSHTAIQNELKDISDDFDNTNWPSDLTEDHKDLLEELNDREGYSFDSLYIASQVRIHQDAELLYSTATTESSNDRIKSFAVKHHPHIQSHSEEAQSIHAEVMADQPN